MISATFQHVLSTLTALCVAMLGVLPAAAFGDCCCESKQPTRVAACCCQTKPAQAARSCCAGKAAKTTVCVVQQSNSGCHCDACHCQAAGEPTPIAQPRINNGARFEAPIALLAPAAIIACGETASAANLSDIPAWLPRPVRERYCVWVI